MIEENEPLEVVGIALDGEPIVRERRNWAQPRRLGVPSEIVEVLHN